MNFYSKRIFTIAGLLSSVFLFRPDYIIGAIGPAVSESNRASISKIISIDIEDNKYGTKINVLGNGNIINFTTKTLDFPPRIVVDIFSSPDSLESKTIPIESPSLTSIRVGYHSNKIRLVLDIKGEDTPVLKASSSDSGLVLFLKSRVAIDRSQEQSDSIQKMRVKKEFPDLEELIEIQVDDGQDDTGLFAKSVDAYKSQNWPTAIENLKSIIRKYPAGRYTEKAYFLLAISSEKMHSDDILNHFIEVKGHYENAINRFPKSIYAPIALLGIGDLCFKTKSYSEALGYYDFILKKYGDKDSDVPIRALRSKAKILFLKKDMDRAVSNLEYLILRYPGSPEETEDKIELSKILYEMHNFRKSLNILSELTISDPEIIYYYSEISLYLGYNYYQLGESLRARENLFRFYNSCPDKEINHLVLAKIGDTYLDEGLTEDAVKLYQLVLEKFHDKEGALISLIRLAEQQEKGNLEIKRGIVSPVKVIGKEIGLANEIYEELMKNILAREEESPLVQLALLKLAIFYHKGGNYDKSLKALKDFFEKYPKTSLDKEWRYALNQTVGEILKEEMKMRRYYDVINFFAREKQLFSMVDSPGPFLDIARAFLSLNMNDMATDMFTKANVFLPDNEKPADLLYHVGSYFFKNGKHEDALSLINILINNYPSDKYAPEACQIKGTIFLEEKKYSQAAEAFSSALLYNLRRCDRAMTLANKAKALIGCNLNQRALEAIKEADSLKMNCYAYNRDIYQEIGDTYLNLGYPKEAFSTFNKALGLEDKNENKIRLKLKIAECYRALDQKKDYLALYNQISSLDDPFWSKYAKERMEEINFSGEVEELEKKEGR